MTNKNLWFSCFFLGIAIVTLGIVAPWRCNGHYSFECTNSLGITWTQGYSEFASGVAFLGFVLISMLSFSGIIWIEIRKTEEPKPIRNVLVFLALLCFVMSLNFNWLCEILGIFCSNFGFYWPSFSLNIFNPLNFSPSMGFVTLITVWLLLFIELRSSDKSKLATAILLILVIFLLITQFLETRFLITQLSFTDGREWIYHTAQGFWVALVGVIFLVLLLLIKRMIYQKSDNSSFLDENDLM